MKTKYRSFIIQNRKQRRKYLKSKDFNKYINEIANYKEQNDALFDEGYNQIQISCGFSLDELINNHYIPQLKKLDAINAKLKQIEFESISPKILRQEFKAKKKITPALFEEMTKFQLSVLEREAQFFQQVVRYFSAVSFKFLQFKFKFNSNIILILIQLICYDFIYERFSIEEEDISNFLLQNYKSKIIDQLLESKTKILKRILELDPSLIGQQEIFELKFTENELRSGLKNRKFKNIGFMLGAGASVSAGIPDFRSKDGLYNQLQKYNLQEPEQIFSLSYFRQNPFAFYQFCREFKFLDDVYKPTVTHNFIKLLQQRNQLKIVFTQNIDGLELKCGINEAKIIQAHGNLRNAHCIDCHQAFPIAQFKEGVINETITRCLQCGGLVKPDIVFFEEQLPRSFFVRSKELCQCDLVIIIGTSLAVYPFAGLLGEIERHTPVVLINRRNEAGIQRENFLFLEGSIDEKINELEKLI